MVLLVRQPSHARTARRSRSSRTARPATSDVVLQLYDIGGEEPPRPGPRGRSLGHQDPAWRPDGKLLLYIKNGRELTRGAPAIYRYDPTTKKVRSLTGPGYISAVVLAGRPVHRRDEDRRLRNRRRHPQRQHGKEVMRVTDDDHSFSPVWSPAGRRRSRSFTSRADRRPADGEARRHRAGLDGHETVDLTKVSGLDGASRPDWFVPPSRSAPPPSAPGRPGRPRPRASPHRRRGRADR